jgi:ATP-dependent DNA helicase RecQ
LNSIHSILENFWGHKNFRPLQEDIIKSVLNGDDTLALLPTGGGKSICFQVPALALEGLCIVVSPLIALMKDQVENLSSRGVKAISITSTMSKREIDIALENCVFGKVKFLYLSPERLTNHLFLERLKSMKVALIAVDEAHCISQWGYDFRPAYLQISKLRELLPGVQVIALTATATSDVVEDIQQRLLFKKQNVFRKSFERSNLSYIVLKEEDKLNRLIKIVNKLQGTGIVYVRNRKKTKEIAEFLMKNKIRADYYHAGLEAAVRSKKQDDWIKDRCRIIVATNAFGMGIDKPDVRFVVHLDLPDCLEAYFQEAGRAGRDEKSAYAIVLYNDSDIIDLSRNFEASYPPIDDIKQSYHAICSHFQIAIGSGEGSVHEFDINLVSSNYKLNPLTVFNSVKFLEREGYLSITEAIAQPSRIFFPISRTNLYEFQIKHQPYDNFLKLLLRSYSGVFDGFVRIDEVELARRANIPTDVIKKTLVQLEKMGVIYYQPRTEQTQLFFLSPRIDVKNLYLSPENYFERKKQAKIKMEAVKSYATSEIHCRSLQLLAYFGEENDHTCGQCDVCLESKKKQLSNKEFQLLHDQIKILITNTPLTITKLKEVLKDHDEEKVLQTVQWLIDNKLLEISDDETLKLAEV